MAAQQADIVLVGSLGTELDVSQRVEYIKAQAGDRFDQLELGFTFFQMSMDDRDDLSYLDSLVPDATEATKRDMATLLDGSVDEAADRIASMREMGISYFTFTIFDSTNTSWETLEKLAAAVK